MIDVDSPRVTENRLRALEGECLVCQEKDKRIEQLKAKLARLEEWLNKALEKDDG